MNRSLVSSACALTLLLACGGAAKKESTSGSTPDAKPVVASFSAANAVITAGDSTQLRWNVSGATQVDISGGVGAVSGSGTLTLAPAATLTYILTASNAAGAVTAQAPVKVVAAPEGSLTASGADIGAGQSATLLPQFTGGTATIDQGIGAVQSGVAVSTGPLSGSRTYTMTVTNEAGRAITKGASVNVIGAPVATITAPSQVSASASASASVPSQSNVTYSWTVSNGTLLSGQGTASLSFQAGTSGTVTLGCTVTNTVGLSSSDTDSVAVVSSTPPPPPSGKVYGAGWAGDSLNNYPIGDSSRKRASFRFRADATGSLQTLRVFWVDNRGSAGGYALGNGGTIKMEVQADDGSASHLPNGTVLGSMVNKPNLSSGVDPTGNAGVFRLMTFPTPVPVVAGTLYHVVFTNIDADPVNNWISVNGIVSWTTDQPQAQMPSSDLSALIDTGSGWKENFTTDGKASLNTPIVDFGYADGHHQGNGYMEIWVGQPRTISASQGVREVFTPKSDVQVDAVNVRLRNTGSGGSLVMRVEKADGTLVGSVTLDGGTIPSDKHRFAGGAFCAPLTLKAGQGYNLVLSAPSGSFVAYPIRDGGAFGFASPTEFGEGHCEFNSGSGWQGWDGWTSSGSSSYVYGDLQFYFRVVN